MTTITIPKNFISNDDLIIMPRKQYESLLKRLEKIEDYEHLWKSATKNKFFKSYSKSDEIYDQI